MENGIYIYALPAAVALMWIVRIFFRKDVNRMQIFIVAGMVSALLAIFSKGTVSLFTFPFFYMAIRQKTAAGGPGKWDALVFLPSLILIPYENSLVVKVFFPVQIAAILIWSIICVKRYNRQRAELYDASSDIAVEYLNQILIFTSLSVVATAIFVVIQDIISTSLVLQVVTAVFMAILLFYLGYYSYRISEASSDELPSPEVQEKIPTESSAAASAEDALGNTASGPIGEHALLQKVIDRKMFLDPSLSLVSLAEALKTNRTYLSAAIHHCKDKNFSEFINELRIEYFIDLIKKEGPDANIKEAAIKSGYSNLQSFYRNFSELMQMTPKTWISKNISDK